MGSAEGPTGQRTASRRSGYSHMYVGDGRPTTVSDSWRRPFLRDCCTKHNTLCTVPVSWSCTSAAPERHNVAHMPACAYAGKNTALFKAYCAVQGMALPSKADLVACVDK